MLCFELSQSRKQSKDQRQINRGIDLQLIIVILEEIKLLLFSSAFSPSEKNRTLEHSNQFSQFHVI